MNELQVFKAGAVPAHIAAYFEDPLNTNIKPRDTVPSLGVTGKVWSISINGDKIQMMKNDPDTGDQVPVSVLPVIILDYAQRRGRTYYEGTYDPNNVTAPKCWSDDGITPHASVKEPQALKCDGCPMAVKGSAHSASGEPTTACQQHRMLAVVPAGKPDFTPLRLKIAITSDWDAQSPDLEAQGWFSFQKYRDDLKSVGCMHTAMIVTKLKFDPNVAYPKILFARQRWLSPEEMAVVAPVTKSDEVKKLLNGSWVSNGVDGTATDPQPAAAPIPAPRAAASIAKVQTPVDRVVAPAHLEDPEEVIANLAPIVKDKASTPVPAPKVEPAAEKIAAQVAVQPAATPAPKAAPTANKAPPAAVETDIPPEVAKLLEDWGD